jgi:hypothetical protein
MVFQRKVRRSNEESGLGSLSLALEVSDWREGLREHVAFLSPLVPVEYRDSRRRGMERGAYSGFAS